MDFHNYVGIIVDIVSDNNNYKLVGKLSNHKPNLYQVTGEQGHRVFWNWEVLAYHVELSNNKLTIFI